MCFSPEMDIGAGVVVGAVGLAGVRHVDRPRQLPLASLPVLFGAHQLTEAFVWWGLRGEVAPATADTALWLYLLFALVALPVLAPVAVLLVEPEPRRRRVMGRFALLGAVVSVVYLRALLDGPVGATIRGHTLSYGVGAPYGELFAVLYALGTVGALVASSHRRIALFGAANAIAVPVLVLLAARAFTSLWCLWAAVASVVIARHVQLSGPATTSGPPTTHAVVPGP
ncbi:MAG TPA: DUF6629 family protein [Acidimicrobiales bacterium]|nr:DUF6629 family protein [Acidimicrobiales bacterium]